jgi:hypothetical protein
MKKPGGGNPPPLTSPWGCPELEYLVQYIAFLYGMPQRYIPGNF